MDSLNYKIWTGELKSESGSIRRCELSPAEREALKAMDVPTKIDTVQRLWHQELHHLVPADLYPYEDITGATDLGPTARRIQKTLNWSSAMISMYYAFAADSERDGKRVISMIVHAMEKRIEQAAVGSLATRREIQAGDIENAHDRYLHLGKKAGIDRAEAVDEMTKKAGAFATDQASLAMRMQESMKKVDGTKPVKKKKSSKAKKAKKAESIPDGITLPYRLRE